MLECSSYCFTMFHAQVSWPLPKPQPPQPRSEWSPGSRHKSPASFWARRKVRNALERGIHRNTSIHRKTCMRKDVKIFQSIKKRPVGPPCRSNTVLKRYQLIGRMSLSSTSQIRSNAGSSKEVFRLQLEGWCMCFPNKAVTCNTLDNRTRLWRPSGNWGGVTLLEIYVLLVGSGECTLKIFIDNRLEP